MKKKRFYSSARKTPAVPRWQKGFCGISWAMSLRVNFDLVITTCDGARETCPFFPGKARHLHWSFNDLAEAKGSENEILSVFRKVRDEIKSKIQEEFSQY